MAKGDQKLRLTKESPPAFLLAAFLRLCEGGSEESEWTFYLSQSIYKVDLRCQWRHIQPVSGTPVLPGEHSVLQLKR